jgi:polysaccharide biosynthesis protein PslE
MIARNPRSENPFVSLRDAGRVLSRHKGKMLLFFSGTMALVVAGLIWYPRTYQSEARLFLRLGRESVSLDPTATLSQVVAVDGSRESEINSELDILRSRLLLEHVVDQLGSEAIVGSADENAGWSPSAAKAAVSKWLNGDISQRERAVAQLESMIWLSTPRKSNVISVGCRAGDPAQAQHILQAFLDAYSTEHVKVNRTVGSHDFFVQQSEFARAQLDKATQDLRDVKNDAGLASIEGQRQTVQAQADTIEVAILANLRAMSSTEAQIASLERALGELPPQLLAEETAGLPNVAADNMRNELYKVQIQEKDASARLTDAHPQVIALRKQVAETQKILDEQESRRSQTTQRLNPVHQSVHTNLMTAQAQHAANKAEAEALEKQKATVQQRIRALNEQEFRITNLTRQVQLLEASYRNYANNREQARIDQALETGRISNVNVAQPPSFVAKPTSPRFLMTLVLGFVIATTGSVVLAFAAEYLDGSMRRPEQIEQELGIPVLFSVPRGVRHDMLSS